MRHCLLIGLLAAYAAWAGPTRLILTPDMLVPEPGCGEVTALLDEQAAVGDPPSGAPMRWWATDQAPEGGYPVSVVLDLKKVRNLSSIWLYDLQGQGTVVCSAGVQGRWAEICRDDLKGFRAWQRHDVKVATRYLRLSREAFGANVGEIALYEETDPELLPFPAPELPAVEEAASEATGRIVVTPEMIVKESEEGNPGDWFDEQELVGDGREPSGKPSQGNWSASHQKYYPLSFHLDLGAVHNLKTVWFYDTYGTGDVLVEAGEPGKWQPLLTENGQGYMTWKKHEVAVSTRYLRFTRKNRSGTFTEVALYEFTERDLAELKAKQAAEKKRAAALAVAEEEAKHRPLVDAGSFFGKLRLVDEIDCAAVDPEREFDCKPEGATKVETVLGRPCRVMPNPEGGEPRYFAYRIGKYKLLQAGKPYLLTVEYPDDVPRTWYIINRGCETQRGFYTGEALGDVIYTYTNNNVEGEAIPQTGKWETWYSLFHLHDRFPALDGPRGDKARPDMPEDGFLVVVAHPEYRSAPLSAGPAVARIRLFEVDDIGKYTQQVTLPPDELPRRRIFWREEMADGVVAGKEKELRGVEDPIDWYRYKASLMEVLGMRTFCKDLLEFGANQGWDPTPYGGHDWVYYAYPDRWGQILEVMNQHGFDILPYYEYAGSKGKHGLNGRKLAKPLTRDDAYTHISWCEKGNADLTDPATLEDFVKMLDCTVFRFKQSSKFAGIWMRTRPSHLPISFGDGALQRFTADTDRLETVTREQLREDKDLLDEYYRWWFGKRRQFLMAIRDVVQAQLGDKQAFLLFTADSSEPGRSLGGGKAIVTDQPDLWTPLAAKVDPELRVVSLQEVIADDLHLKAQVAVPWTWGGWEWQHSVPQPDPANYKQTPGIMMSYTFNRAYTVGSATAFEAFRSPAGLTIIRHYPLNENVMGKLLGYFVCDVERPGPYCMQSEVEAVAKGDPSNIGYLAGNCYNRGFPEYTRRFNAAFLALPALPSQVVKGACDDPEVIVRAIPTPTHGTWLAVANIGLKAKPEVKLTLPVEGALTDAVSGAAMPLQNRHLTISMDACELRSLHLR